MKTTVFFSSFWSAALLGLMLVFSDAVRAQTPIVLDPPAGTVDGVNVINGSTVIVQLRAPGKDYVHLRGDFNNFVQHLLVDEEECRWESALVAAQWLESWNMVSLSFPRGGQLGNWRSVCPTRVGPWNDQYIPKVTFQACRRSVRAGPLAQHGVSHGQSLLLVDGQRLPASAFRSPCDLRDVGPRL